MVGQALVGRLAAEECEILIIDRASVDLRGQVATQAWMNYACPGADSCRGHGWGDFANSSYPAIFLSR